MTVHEFPRDHGSLANLDKDHHPQYLQQAGDLLIGELGIDSGKGGALHPYLGVNVKADTDAPSTWPRGLSYMELADAPGWPTGHGTVIANIVGTLSGAGRGYQMVSDGYQDGAPAWIRRVLSTPDTWSSWVLISHLPRQTLSLVNSWTHYGGEYGNATFQKLAGDIVKIEGLIKPGTATTFATLPAGYIPEKSLIFTGATGNSNSVGRIDVKNTGALISQGGTSMGWLSLSNITYVATQ